MSKNSITIELKTNTGQVFKLTPEEAKDIYEKLYSIFNGNSKEIIQYVPYYISYYNPLTFPIFPNMISSQTNNITKLD